MSEELRAGGVENTSDMAGDAGASSDAVALAPTSVAGGSENIVAVDEEVVVGGEKSIVGGNENVAGREGVVTGGKGIVAEGEKIVTGGEENVAQERKIAVRDAEISEEDRERAKALLEAARAETEAGLRITEKYRKKILVVVAVGVGVILVAGVAGLALSGGWFGGGGMGDGVGNGGLPSGGGGGSSSGGSSGEAGDGQGDDMGEESGGTDISDFEGTVVGSGGVLAPTDARVKRIWALIEGFSAEVYTDKEVLGEEGGKAQLSMRIMLDYVASDVATQRCLLENTEDELVRRYQQSELAKTEGWFQKEPDGSAGYRNFMAGLNARYDEGCLPGARLKEMISEKFGEDVKFAVGTGLQRRDDYFQYDRTMDEFYFVRKMAENRAISHTLESATEKGSRIYIVETVSVGQVEQSGQTGQSGQSGQTGVDKLAGTRWKWTFKRSATGLYKFEGLKKDAEAN